MEIRLNNVLDIQLLNDDTEIFIDLFGNLKKTIQDESKKVGFKQNNHYSIELSANTIEFINSFCENAGIVTKEELDNLEKNNENNNQNNSEDNNG